MAVKPHFKYHRVAPVQCQPWQLVLAPMSTVLLSIRSHWTELYSWWRISIFHHEWCYEWFIGESLFTLKNSPKLPCSQPHTRTVMDMPMSPYNSIHILVLLCAESNYQSQARAPSLVAPYFYCDWLTPAYCFTKDFTLVPFYVVNIFVDFLIICGIYSWFIHHLLRS